MTRKRPQRIVFETREGELRTAFIDYGYDADELLARVLDALRKDIEAQEDPTQH